LTGDGIITDADLRLKLPRLAPWTYAVGFTYDHDLGDLGYLTGRLNFAHRDVAAYTDSNVGFINSADVLDASLAWTTRNDQLTFSVYGRNLLDEAWAGGDTQLPFPAPGSSFSPLNRGLVAGFEVQLNFFNPR
jgi:iron complex outermembrane receptor protein